MDTPAGIGAVTVRELLANSALRLRVLAGAGSLDREISWAHASELADPSEFLRGGELLLITGVNLPADDPGRRDYVLRLADSGVAAIGFAAGVIWPRVPAALLAAAEQAAMPLLEVPFEVPFLAISRAVAAAINRREQAATEYVLRAQRSLTAAAAGSGQLAERLVALLTELVRLVGGWALLLNHAGTELAAVPESAAGRGADLTPDLARLRVARGAASLVNRDGGTQTWVQSLRAGEELLGFLAVGRAGSLTAVARQVVNAAVPLCTLLLDRVASAREAGRRLRGGVLRLLLTGVGPVTAPAPTQRRAGAGTDQAPTDQAGPGAGALAVTELVGELWRGLPAEPVLVWVCRAAPPEPTRVPGSVAGSVTNPAPAGSSPVPASVWHRLDGDAEVAAAPVLYGELDGALVGLATSGPAAEHALELVAQVAGTWVGVSDPADYRTLPRAWRQARRAAAHRPGAAADPRPRVVHFHQLPRRGVLELLGTEVAGEFSAALLDPLRGQSRGELVRSLRVWLAHHGQWDPAAAELGVHRHTLRNRMTKVQRLLGADLGSPALRAELWLALRAAEDRASR